MRKKMMLLGFVVLTMLILIGCSEDDGGSTTSVINEQNVVCWISEYEGVDKQYYYDLDIEGVLIASPTPEFNYFKIDNSTYDNSWNYRLNPGYGWFSLTSEEEEALDLGDDLTFEFSTDLGVMSGTQSRPAIIHDLLINGASEDSLHLPENQIDVGDEVVVSWSYGLEKPDFIAIFGFYEYYDGFDWYEIEFSDYVSNTENSVTIFERYDLNYDGELYFAIQPMNGQNPESGADLSLQGTGTGYLYWMYMNQDYDIGVQIGSGYYKTKIDHDSKEIKLRELRESLKEAIIEKLK